MDYLSIACESYFLCKSITKFVINSRCFRCVRSAGRVITIQHIVMEFVAAYLCENRHLVC